MKKILSSLLLVLALMHVLSSCSSFDIDTDIPEGGSSSYGAYILNSGMMGSNNSKLTYFDLLSGTLTTNIFSTQNGRGIGDSANDMLIYGSKMYISVTGSAVVFITDLKGKLIDQVELIGEDTKLAPRQLMSDGGKVYISYREGYIASVDTSTFAVTKAKVGPYPEGMACVGNKIYVAITDANNHPNYANIVQVLDKATLQVEKELEVAYNPQTFHKVSSQWLYLVSRGNYGDKPAALQKINLLTDEVVTIEGVYPTLMVIADQGYAYILSTEYDADWNESVKYYKFNIDEEKVEVFVTEELVPHGYCIARDPLTGYILIGTSDYISTGDVYILTHRGELVHKFDTGAMNPYKICFVSAK